MRYFSNSLYNSATAKPAAVERRPVLFYSRKRVGDRGTTDGVSGKYRIGIGALFIGLLKRWVAWSKPLTDEKYPQIKDWITRIR